MTLDLATLRQRIAACMQIDQPRFRKRLRDLNGKTKRKRDADRPHNRTDSLERLAQDIETSRTRRLTRQQPEHRPDAPCDPSLPIADKAQAIGRAIREHQVVIVCGETGSGKSTQLPKIALQAGRGVAGMIGHTQPRRLAARSIAARIADELNTNLGDVVGYQVRFNDRVSHDSFIKVMTDGIILNEIQRDRLLLRYDTIIIDEAHERSLNIDFLIGYLKSILAKRRDLRVIITSATIDPERFSKHFDDAPIIEVSGRMFPVDIEYRPLKSDEEDQRDRDLQSAVVDAVDEAFSIDDGDHDSAGDMLIFMSGEREIRRTAERLRRHNLINTEILPLYARLSANEQDRVFKPHNGRRIVIATNVAETSLTVPNIRFVIDPGFARISRYSARSAVQRLPIEPISRASADQRAGRCGRVREGICFRLYSEDDYNQREQYTSPEILRTNLASVILQMKSLGLGDPERFPFIDPPRASMVRDGLQTLRELHALDENDQLTDIGRTLARWPIDPRLGRMILQANEEGSLAELIIIASALAAQDPRLRPMDEAELADAAHRPYNDPRSDFLWYVNFWNAYHEQKESLSGNQLRKWCRNHYISYVRMREWIDTVRQMRDVARQDKLTFNDEPASYGAVHRALIAGLLSFVGRRSDEFTFTNPHNREFNIFPGSVLFEKPPKWVVAAEIVETEKPYARNVARVEPNWIERLADHIVTKTHRDPYWEERSAQVKALQTVKLYNLELTSSRRVHYGPIDPHTSRRLFIQHALVEGAYDTNAPFFQHNRDLATKIENLEEKLRRRNLLAGYEARHNFYDQIIPPDVYSGRRFEKWRRRAESKDPNLLFMQEEDLLNATGGTVESLGEGFPDTWRVADGQLSITYRFEPGHAEDGLTLHVPVELIDHIDPIDLDWLVPGHRREKIIAMIKALPKDLRRQLSPPGEYADAILPRLQRTDKPLAEDLSEQIQQLTGLEISPEQWRSATEPDHLRMNIRVFDEQGETLARSRSLQRIKRDLANHLQGAVRSTETAAYEREHITEWDFGELAREIRYTRHGVEITCYPALVDAGEDVAMQVFKSAHEADRAMRAGLRRLFYLQIKHELQPHIDHLLADSELEAQYAWHTHGESLREHLALLAVDRAFIGDDANVRTEAQFKQRLETGWANVAHEAAETTTRLREIMNAQQAALDAIAAARAPQWRDALQDMQQHLDELMPSDFLLQTPFEVLRCYPRYLRAIAERCERLKHGGHVRDAKLMEEFQPWLATYHQLAGDPTLANASNGEIDTLRWMLEEWRMNLFAPETKSPHNVSRKRIEKQITRIEQLRGDLPYL